MRIGQGFDVHALVPGRKLVVGGVEIPFERGLLGHSDADVLLHAITDALLGAAGLGDIGGISRTAMRASRMPTAGNCCARRRG
jgi:2-C-methyl-D-erythritol 2,4-cyclodiphosphate synthase